MHRTHVYMYKNISTRRQPELLSPVAHFVSQGVRRFFFFISLNSSPSQYRCKSSKIFVFLIDNVRRCRYACIPVRTYIACYAFFSAKKITEKLSRMRYLFHSFLSTLPLYGYSFIILLFYSLFLSTLQLCSCSCKSSNIFVFPIENVPPFRNAYCMLLRVFLV